MFSSYDPDKGDDDPYDDDEGPVARAMRLLIAVLLLSLFGIIAWAILKDRLSEETVPPAAPTEETQPEEVSEAGTNDLRPADPAPIIATEIHDVQIDPGGTRLTYVRREGNVSNIWIVPVDDPFAAQAITANETPGGIRHGWAYDGRHLLFRHQPEGLVALDVETGALVPLNPAPGGFDVGYFLSPWHPEELLLEFRAGIDQPTNLYRVNIATGASTFYEQGGPPNVFVPDLDFIVQAGARRHGAGQQIFARREEGWEELHLTGGAPGEEFGGLHLGAGHNLLYLLDTVGCAHLCLSSIDLATGDRHLVAANPDFTITDVLYEPATGEPFAYHLDTDERAWHALDMRYHEAIETLNERFRSGFDITSQSLDNRTWVIATEGTYRLFELDDLQLTTLNLR